MHKFMHHVKTIIQLLLLIDIVYQTQGQFQNQLPTSSGAVRNALGQLGEVVPPPTYEDDVGQGEDGDSQSSLPNRNPDIFDSESANPSSARLGIRSSEGICKYGWKLAEMNNVPICIYINEEELSWEDAKQTCRQDYGFLLKAEAPVYIGSKSIGEYLRKKNILNVWTGLHENKGTLIWDELAPHKVRPYNAFLESIVKSGRTWDWDIDNDTDDEDVCGDLDLSSIKVPVEEEMLKRKRRKTNEEARTRKRRNIIFNEEPNIRKRRNPEENTNPEMTFSKEPISNNPVDTLFERNGRRKSLRPFRPYGSENKHKRMSSEPTTTIQNRQGRPFQDLAFLNSPRNDMSSDQRRQQHNSYDQNSEWPPSNDFSEGFGFGDGFPNPMLSETVQDNIMQTDKVSKTDIKGENSEGGSPHESPGTNKESGNWNTNMETTHSPDSLVVTSNIRSSDMPQNIEDITPSPTDDGDSDSPILTTIPPEINTIENLEIKSEFSKRPDLDNIPDFNPVKEASNAESPDSIIQTFEEKLKALRNKDLENLSVKSEDGTDDLSQNSRITAKPKFPILENHIPDITEIGNADQAINLDLLNAFVRNNRTEITTTDNPVTTSKISDSIEPAFSFLAPENNTDEKLQNINQPKRKIGTNNRMGSNSRSIENNLPISNMTDTSVTSNLPTVLTTSTISGITMDIPNLNEDESGESNEDLQTTNNTVQSLTTTEPLDSLTNRNTDLEITSPDDIFGTNGVIGIASKSSKMESTTSAVFGSTISKNHLGKTTTGVLDASQSTVQSSSEYLQTTLDDDSTTYDSSSDGSEDSKELGDSSKISKSSEDSDSKENDDGSSSDDIDKLALNNTNEDYKSSDADVSDTQDDNTDPASSNDDDQDNDDYSDESPDEDDSTTANTSNNDDDYDEDVNTQNVIGIASPTTDSNRGTIATQGLDNEDDSAEDNSGTDKSVSTFTTHLPTTKDSSEEINDSSEDDQTTTKTTDENTSDEKDDGFTSIPIDMDLMERIQSTVTHTTENILDSTETSSDANAQENSNESTEKDIDDDDDDDDSDDLNQNFDSKSTSSEIDDNNLNQSAIIPVTHDSSEDIKSDNSASETSKETSSEALEELASVPSEETASEISKEEMISETSEDTSLEELAKSISETSDDYVSEELEDTPTDVLEKLTSESTEDISTEAPDDTIAEVSEENAYDGSPETSSEASEKKSPESKEIDDMGEENDNEISKENGNDMSVENNREDSGEIESKVSKSGGDLEIEDLMSVKTFIIEEDSEEYDDISDELPSNFAQKTSEERVLEDLDAVEDIEEFVPPADIVQQISHNTENRKQYRKKIGMRLSRCKVRKPSVCFSPPIVMEDQASTCPVGWYGHIFTDKCYKVIVSRMPFAAAIERCRNEGGSLANMEDNTFHEALVLMSIRKSQTEGFVVGPQSAFWVQKLSQAGPCRALTVNGYMEVSCNSPAEVVCERPSQLQAATSSDDDIDDDDDDNEDSHEPKRIFLSVGYDISRLPCGLTNTNRELPTVWFKDGKIVDIKLERRSPSLVSLLGVMGRPLTPLPEPALTSSNALELGPMFRKTLEYSSGQKLSAEMFQGNYWCEVWNVNPFSRRRSREYAVRYSDVITFRGTIELPDMSHKGILLHNLINQQDPKLNNIMTDINYINDIILPVLKNNVPSIKSVSTYEGKIEETNPVKMGYYMFLKTTNNYTMADENMAYLVLRRQLRETMKNTKMLLTLPGKTPLHIVRSIDVTSTVACPLGHLKDKDTGLIATFPRSSIDTEVNSIEMCEGAVAGRAVCKGNYNSGAYWDNIQVTKTCNNQSNTVTENDEEDEDEDSIFERMTVEDRLKELADMDMEDDNAEGIMEETASIVEKVEEMTANDVDYIAEIMDKTVNLKTITKEVGMNVLKTMDKVMSIDEDEIEKANDISKASNRILKSFEKVAENIYVENDGHLRLVQPNVAMEVWKLNKVQMPIIGMAAKQGKGGSLDEIFNEDRIFTIFNQSQLYGDIDAAIELPPELIADAMVNEKGERDDTRLYMMVYRDGRLFRGVNKANKIDITKDVRLGVLNSYVISASIGGRQIKGLKSKVKTVFKPIVAAGNDERKCAFWDFSMNNKIGGWSTAGCVYNGQINGRDICLCDHLTNFAVLIDFYGQGEPVSRDHEFSLSIISLVGLSLSILGLSLTIISYVFFRKLRQGRAQQTLFNLALAMLCSWVVFLTGIRQTHNVIGCIIVAVLLHYFILSSFMWMLMEAFLQYLTFVKVLGTYVTRYTLKTVLIAWGMPLIPIIVVLSIDHNLYRGGDRYCWMSLDAFYYAFALPVGLIILCNLIVFILTVTSICRRPTGLRSNQSKQKIALTNLQAAITSFVLLGLTWLLGYLAISDARVVFQYAFTILNSLQGFFIFVLFVARKKQVRDQWLIVCCCKDPKLEKASRSLSASASIPSTCSGRSSYSGRSDRSDSTRTTSSFIHNDYEAIYTLPYSRHSRDSLYYRKI